MNNIDKSNDKSNDKSIQIAFGIVLPIIISIIGVIINLGSLQYYKEQAQSGFASQTPYLILLTEYNLFDNRRGLFLSNQGKGVAIIESIKVNGNSKRSITQDDWIKLLNEKNIQSSCFDLSIPLHIGMAINENSSIPIIATTIDYTKFIDEMNNVNNKMNYNIVNIHRLDFFREIFSLLKDEKIHSKQIESKFNELIANEKDRMNKTLEEFNKNKRELMSCSNDSIIENLERNIHIEITYKSLLEKNKIEKVKRFTLFKKEG